MAGFHNGSQEGLLVADTSEVRGRGARYDGSFAEMVPQDRAAVCVEVYDRP